MKSNIMKIFAITALMIFIGAAHPWQTTTVGITGVTLTATTSIGFITITTMHRPDQFTLSITIARL